MSPPANFTTSRSTIVNTLQSINRTEISNSGLDKNKKSQS